MLLFFVSTAKNASATQKIREYAWNCHYSSINKILYPSFYRNISLLKSLTDSSVTYETQFEPFAQYDLFDRSSMIYLGEPVAIQHKNTLVRYKNQPSFRAVVDLLKVEALHYKNEIYLPLGKWNELLGLKIMSQEKQVMSRKLTIG